MTFSANDLKFNAKRFGQFLRYHRIAMEMTQDQLHDESGISTTFISELENGKRQPSLLTAAKLGRCLGVGIDDMVSVACGG